ncbi:hypothetical protein, partial [Occultella aeris]|uniref:hypothetical protein n=1 Tax=Occultella aeris TaxID=2761496 RepID=UPI001E41D45A
LTSPTITAEHVLVVAPDRLGAEPRGRRPGGRGGGCGQICRQICGRGTWEGARTPGVRPMADTRAF